ncbi:MAG: hypothetical protein PHT15_04875 [Gallionellaceae bacterium]|nr:hypothetical protein [Gallionellaceae bacterium]
MADPTTWIDVADNAVKVGLGALIGGSFTYFITRLDHDRESKKEYAKRRLDKIEIVFDEINSFFKSASFYWANLANGVYKKGNGTFAENDQETLDKEEQELFESFSTLSSAKAKLILLAESSIVEKLEQYKTSCDDFFKIANISNPKCTEENLITHKKAMDKSGRTLLDALSKAYGKCA